MKINCKDVIEKEIKLSEIKFDEKFYPRKEHDPALVQQYAHNLEEIESIGNCISVSKDMTLLDGKHRYLAYLKNNNGNGEVKIKVRVYDFESDADKFAKAVELNSTHGKQLTQEEKRHSVKALYVSSNAVFLNRILNRKGKLL